MTDPEPSDVDPRRVRIGLVFLTVVVLVALVLAFVIDNGLGRVLMIGIVVFTVARAFVLMRSIRRGS